jgi:hypothetical protein
VSVGRGRQAEGGRSREGGRSSRRRDRGGEREVSVEKIRMRESTERGWENI